MVQNINTVNIYTMQKNFNDFMNVFTKEYDVTKEVAAECCLGWVRQNAKWE